MPDQGDVTRLLARLAAGGRETLDELLPLVYDELKQVARRRLQNERTGHTLMTTDLVHEAYLKLAGFDRIHWENRAHFYALAAGIMRRILVDHAVRRNARKRGGDRRQVPLEEVELPVEYAGADLIALDAALERLAALNQRQARVVECRYFGGMNVKDTAEALGISAATVKRDWTVARAWLHRELEE
jgi:RNA polymerase sigma factor (TIGR02999 family)